MTNSTPTLTEKEFSALKAVVNMGLEAMCGERAADLLEDNMSWFNGQDLMEAMGVDRQAAGGLMSALEAKGLAVDSGESPGNRGGTDWYLTDRGIETAVSLGL